MRVLFSILLTLCVFTASAEALEELSARLAAMPAYDSAITVTAQGSRIEGHYYISGEDWYINLGSVEIWGEGDKRYEVSHKTEEVVVERATRDGAALLMSNPARAFSFAVKDFDVVTNGTTLTLTPKEESAGIDSIIIELEPVTLLPKKITYTAGNDTASVAFGGIKESAKPHKRFNPSAYKKYETVDLY